MAVRYSGDVEVNMTREGNTFFASLRAPRFRAKGHLTLADIRRLTGKRAFVGLSESYDAAALAFLREALAKAPELPVQRREGRLHVERVFQAPCPYRE
jgi:hypothetical protein